jgi:multidrug transporter EmrE-like cation transporter
MKILLGIFFQLIAQATTFMQLQGRLKYDIMKNNTWAVVLMGIPISFMYMLSVKYFVEAFDGQLWPSRLIGFGIGVFVFSIMSSMLFKEPFTPKTIVCLGLGFLIVALQIFWK